MYFFIPYERNPFFTGRERALAEIATAFSAPLSELRIVEIVGMPGSGKSEVALEYAYRHYQQYRAVIWLLASSYHQLAENISELFATFGMKLAWRTEDERAVVFERFRWWLRQYSSRFLLILDHCDNYNLVNAVLDDNVVGRVVLTNDALDTVDAEAIITVLVPPFDKEEGPLFLLCRAGVLARNAPLRSASRAAWLAALAIHTEFGGHPLALDQAGAYLNEMSIPVSEYLSHYQQDPRAFLQWRGTAAAILHPLSAYDVVAAMRQGRAREAEPLLKLYITKQLDCSNPSPRLPPTLNDLALNPADLLAMRHTLLQQFLLLPNRRTYSIHPLVETVMRDIWAYEAAEQQRGQQEEAAYEPLNEESIVQLLTDVQQMKKRRAALEKDNPERMQLQRRINTTVIRLKKAVQLGPTEQRAAQKSKIEMYYAGVITGKDAPLFQASQHDVRQYAQELLALMEYR